MQPLNKEKKPESFDLYLDKMDENDLDKLYKALQEKQNKTHENSDITPQTNIQLVNPNSTKKKSRKIINHKKYSIFNSQIITD